MRRWFRKKHHETPDLGEEAVSPPAGEPEETAPPQAEETSLAPEPPEVSPQTETAVVPETVTAGVPETAPPEGESAETPAAADTPAAPPRRGLFHRLFGPDVPPEEVEPAGEEVPPEPADQPPPALEEAAPAPPDQPPLAEAAMEEASPEEVGQPPALEEAPELTVEAAAEEPILDLEVELKDEDPAVLEVRKSRFRRFRERLGRTRKALAGGLELLFLGDRELDAAVLEELEELLITADLGVDTTLHLTEAIRDRVQRQELRDAARLKEALREEMVRLLTAPPAPAPSARPWVVLLVGVNGVGKTTTIAKLAHRDRAQGLTPLLIAGDTFRAAAVEQLEIWGERVGAQVVKQKSGADPAAVVFDGLTAAQARGADTVYVDTAGRLQTKVNLMEELKKIHRTAAKKLPGAPHETLLILDATTGQNALSQARIFHEAVGVTGIIITKLDGTAKGGMALAVAHETGLPLRYVGVGESMDDLQPFDPEAFVAAILG